MTMSTFPLLQHQHSMPMHSLQDQKVQANTLQWQAQEAGMAKVVEVEERLILLACPLMLHSLHLLETCRMM